MPITVHEKNYIKKQKIINLIFIVISLIIMLFFYLIYKLYTHSTITIYLVLAALCSIPAAQCIVRYSLFLGQKDCSPKIADDLNKLPTNCYIINSALFTNGKKNSFMDHIIISGDIIICLVDYSKKSNADSISTLQSILDSTYHLEVIYLHNYTYEAITKYISSASTNNTEKLFITIKTHLI